MVRNTGLRALSSLLITAALGAVPSCQGIGFEAAGEVAGVSGWFSGRMIRHGVG